MLDWTFANKPVHQQVWRINMDLASEVNVSLRKFSEKVTAYHCDFTDGEGKEKGTLIHHSP